MSNARDTESLWGRRSWITRVFWGALLVPAGASMAGFARFLFPRVLSEPPTAFKAGRPEDYEVDSVSARWMKEHKVWVVRTRRGIYALFAQCTHLGCTPDWVDRANKFKCGCHGSGFRRSGMQFEGPAPRPLERCHLELDAEGEIVIDTARRYREERGEWSEPGALLVT